MRKKDMFAVIGLGRFGSAVTRQLYGMGYDVLAIDSDEQLVEDNSKYATHAVCCDAKSEGALRAAGVDGCTCAVVAIGDVTDSVLTTLILKEMNVHKLICKANDMNHKKVLEKIGANKVVIPEYEMGVKLAMRLVTSDIRDIMEVSQEFGIIDIKVPESWVDKTLREIDIRKKYGLNIIAVKNENNKAVLPAPDYKFNTNDMVIVAGNYSDMDAISKL